MKAQVGACQSLLMWSKNLYWHLFENVTRCRKSASSKCNNLFLLVGCCILLKSYVRQAISMKEGPIAVT